MPFAEVNNQRLYYRSRGDDRRPPVVLVNSLGTDCRIWEDLESAVGDRARTLRYDQRGQGLSDTPAGPYAIEDHARDLLGLLEALGWGPAVLCGLSIGGMIVLKACALRAGAVRGLVLADTSDRIGPPEFWDTRMNQVREAGIAPIAGEVMQRWFGSGFRREHSVQVRGWANLLRQAPVEGYLGSCAALRDGDLGSVLGGISVPALCICGSEDESTTPAQVRRLAAGLPNAVYAEIPGAGHLVPLERPRAFARLLTGFLEEHVHD